ncbi:MAG: hypothetical protein H0V70_03750 [Ktedonobacteraceae bacterium]|nr:hypothetical protein [Ktedonobacteraceae bacterium]
MRLRWITWGWPLCILLFTLAVTLLTFMFPDIGARPVVIMAFLFVIPGMAVVRFFRIEDIAIEFMLAIALSFSIDAFTAGIILYAGHWSPQNILGFLIGFCFSGAIAQLVLVRPVLALTQPLVTWNAQEQEGKMIIDLAHAPSSRQKAEKTRAIIEMANSLSHHDEDADITLEVAKISSHKAQDEDADITLEVAKISSRKVQNEDATLEIAKIPSLKPKNGDADVTVVLGKIPPSGLQNEDAERTINLKRQPDTENTEEQTVSLDTSNLSRKET